MMAPQALTPERHDEILKVIEERGARLEPITVRHLSAAAHISTTTASVLLNGWLRAGVLRKAANYTDRRPLYDVVPPDQRPSSQRRTAEQNMWDAMKGLAVFTPVDLAAHATTEEIAVTEQKARDYCQQLMAGGYLRCTQKGTKTRAPEYALIRRTGAIAPLERRVRAISDPNTGQFHVIGVHK
jgi:hypothetical protein